MTLDSKHSKDVYQGNGSTTAFPFAFKVWNTSQITVTVTDAAGVSTDVTSNSTVTLTSSGGSVTYPKTGSPLPSGAKLAITRNMPFTQGINLTTASRFDPQVLEDGLDQATAERQQIQEQMARAVILPATSNESPQDVVTSIYASRDAAAASANEASAQATAAAGSATAAANSASTAAQTVQMATADAVTAATTQANAAQNAAAAAAQSALDAAAAVPDTLVERVTATETKNTQQDTRLDAVESKNTQQDTRLTSAETGLAGKMNADGSNADLSKFNILLQRVEYKTSDVATGTAAIPSDDTIPQITEGTQFLAKSFTPKSSTSILEIEVCVSCAQTSSTTLTVALFDGGSDAIAVMPVAMTANYMAVVTFKCVVPSSSTATRTYTVRVGDDASAQVTINGFGGVRKFGGKLYSSIRIKEYAV